MLRKCKFVQILPITPTVISNTCTHVTIIGIRKQLVSLTNFHIVAINRYINIGPLARCLFRLPARLSHHCLYYTSLTGLCTQSCVRPGLFDFNHDLNHSKKSLIYKKSFLLLSYMNLPGWVECFVCLMHLLV